MTKKSDADRRLLALSALAKLGPERCRRGLEAFTAPTANNCTWATCFLGYAYGAPGALRVALPGFVRTAQVSELLGLTPEEVGAVCDYWDFPKLRSDFEVMVRAHL